MYKHGPNDCICGELLVAHVGTVAFTVILQAVFKKKIKHEENWHLKCVYSSLSRQIEPFTQRDRCKVHFGVGSYEWRAGNQDILGRAGPWSPAREQQDRPCPGFYSHIMTMTVLFVRSWASYITDYSKPIYGVGYFSGPNIIPVTSLAWYLMQPLTFPCFLCPIIILEPRRWWLFFPFYSHCPSSLPLCSM